LWPSECTTSTTTLFFVDDDVRFSWRAIDVKLMAVFTHADHDKLYTTSMSLSLLQIDNSWPAPTTAVAES